MKQRQTMGEFDKAILTEIIKEFPTWEKFNNTESRYLEIEVPSKFNSALGGLIIQTSNDRNIWIRNYQPYSSYIVDNVTDLIPIVKGILEDKILWVLEFKNEKWTGTTFITNISNLETEKGMTYKILSWSGALDESFSVD